MVCTKLVQCVALNWCELSDWGVFLSCCTKLMHPRRVARCKSLDLRGCEPGLAGTQTALIAVEIF